MAQKVTADDEWVAEAYMETDYSKLSKEDFERVLLDYAMFGMSTSMETDEESGSEDEE
ncbi:hypothetical protein [Mycobacterium avium]|uniref:hypothetical protein n=1 Tax=Mycobacterium avium TaxID=1764 RepID=UPI0018C8757E|nr:hypothetical protein [Mycobacterium avium]